MPGIKEEVKNRVVAGPLRKVKGEKFDSPKEMSNRRHLPTFMLTSEDLPEIKNWQIGKEYKVGMVVEQVSIRKGGFDEDSNKIEANFKVKKIAANPGAYPASKMERLKEKFSGK